jgi:polyhydroxybutyrate depolymerase
MKALSLLAVSILCLAACGADSASAPGPVTTKVRTPPSQRVFGNDRPVTLNVPVDYDDSIPTPLLIVLHGYGADGDLQAAYLGMDKLVNEQGILMAAPNGTIDKTGSRFWNATDACCDLYHSGVDDLGYLTQLITDISSTYNVDPKRVYVAGHSNGAFMAYRLACDRASLVAAIMSLAGDTYDDASKCAPSEDVSVLQILYGGDEGIPSLLGTYPGSVGSIQRWAGYDQCTGPLFAQTQTYNLDAILLGKETSVQTISQCPAGMAVDLWTINGGAHVPTLTDEFHDDVWTWLAAHPKP